MFKKVYTGVFLTPEDLQRVNDLIKDAVTRALPPKRKTIRYIHGLPVGDPLAAPPDPMRSVINKIHELAVKKYGLPRRDKVVYGVEPTGEIIYLVLDIEDAKNVLLGN